MKHLHLLLFLFCGFSQNSIAQTWTSSPTISSGLYTGCGSSTVSCSFGPVLGASLIKARLTSLNSTTAVIRMRKCSGTFQSLGTLYVKNDICDINGIASTSYSAGDSAMSLTFTHNVGYGQSKTFYATITSSTGDRYYAQPITITGPTCNFTTITSAYGTNITNNSFTANWPTVIGASSYNINYTLSSNSNYSTGGSLTNVVGNSVPISGLTCGETYKFQVQSNCPGGVSSLWSGSSPNITLAQCNTPNENSFSASSISSTGFVANWPAVSNAVGYEVNITNCSNTQYTGTPVYTTSTSYSFSGLSSSTSYKFQVRAKCSGSCYSLWSGSSPCVTTTLPPAPQLTISSVLTVNPTTYTQSQYGQRTVTLYNAGNATWSGDFALRLTNISDGTWVDADVFSNVSIPAGTSYPLTGSSSKVSSAVGNYKLEVYKKPTGGSYSFGIGSGDTKYFSIVDPLNETGFFVTNITNQSAKIHWKLNNGVVKSKILKYQVNVTTCSDANYVNATLYTNITDTFLTLNNLLPNTQYKFQVQPVFYNDAATQLIVGSFSGSIADVNNNIACFTTLGSAQLCIYSPITITPSSFIQTQSGAREVTVKNVGGVTWTGDLVMRMTPYVVSNPPYDEIATATGVTIPPNSTYTLSGFSNKIKRNVGDYRLDIWKNQNNSWTYGIGCGYYDDTLLIHIVDPFQPTQYFADNITSTSAKLHWAFKPGVDKSKILKYNVNVTTCGDANYSNAILYDNITDTFVTITGLLPNTLYKFQVQGVYYNDQNIIDSTNWSGSISGGTNVNCFSTLSPATFNLVAGTAAVNPNPLVQGQNGTISNTLTNIGNAPFTGYLMLSWHDNNNNVITDLNSNYNTLITLANNQSITLSKTPGNIQSAPGTYIVVTKYSLLPTGPYFEIKHDTVEVVAPNTCMGCTSWVNPPAVGTMACTATSYLCSQNYIQPNQDGQLNNTQAILRNDLAWLIYKVLYNGAGALSDYFPTNYLDLPSTNREAALALSHLRFQDAITPFDNDEDFNPNLPIARKYALKVFLEAWNIAPDSSGFMENDLTSSSFACDVTKGHEMYGYLKKAHDLQLITGYGSPYCTCTSPNLCLNPDGNITREEAFIIMYRLLQLSNYPKPIPDSADYYWPPNITNETLRQEIGKAKGGFKEYAESAFVLNGQVPLSFMLSYDATRTNQDLLNYFLFNKKQGYQYNFESLGKGWTHNYNSYIVFQKGELTNSYLDDHAIVRYNDGSFSVFNYTSPNTFEPLTKGTYETLIWTGTEYQLKFKNQVVQHYGYLGNNHNRAVLTSIQDRFNNTVILEWDTVTNILNKGFPRLRKVNDPYGRYLYFDYDIFGKHYLISKVTCVANSYVRYVTMSYENNKEDLATFSNAEQKTTSYDYYTETKKKHLLKEVQKPKGNKLYCDFDNNRRLKRTSLTPILNALDGDEFINSQVSYQASGVTTTSIISRKPASGTGQAHLTTQQFDENGNLTNRVETNQTTSPTSSVTLEYNDPQNPTLPTKITNNKINVSTTITYDNSNSFKRGNLMTTSTTAGATTLNTSNTYNLLNDLETSLDVGNVQTIFGYVSGALTSITRNGISTTIVPNTNGSISSITHAGVTANFGYNVYGNRNHVDISGTSISTDAIYDDASRIIQITNTTGRIDKVTQYDKLDNALTLVTDFNGLNLTTQQVFDDNGNQTHFTKEGQTTQWNFHAVTDDLVQESFGGLSNFWSYGLDHTLQTFTNKNGTVFNQSYFSNSDAREGLLSSDGYAAYDYFLNSLNLQKVIKDGKQIVFTYDELQRPNSCSYSDNIPNNIIGHSFNNYGSDITTNYRNGNVVIHVRNLNNQITETKWNGVTVHKRNYEANTGRELSQEWGQGLITKSNTYENNTGNLIAMDYYNSNNQSLYYEHYTSLDHAGNHITEDIKELPTLLAPIPSPTSFTYPPNSLNQNTTDTNGSTMSYNYNGVQLTGALNATADERDNILTIQKGLYSATMEYDGLEVRRRKNSTRYVVDVLDGNKVLEETDLNGNALWYNIWSGGDLVCRINAQTNEKYYPVSSFNGAVRLWINDAGTVTHAYYYDADGNVLSKMEAFPQPYQYAGIFGAQTDAPDIIYMQARYYRPSQRRFISADPILSDNMYAYAGNNPVMNVDPGGEAYEISVGMSASLFFTFGVAVIYRETDNGRWGLYLGFPIEVSSPDISAYANFTNYSTPNLKLNDMRKKADDFQSTVAIEILGVGVSETVTNNDYNNPLTCGSAFLVNGCSNMDQSEQSMGLGWGGYNGKGGRPIPVAKLGTSIDVQIAGGKHTYKPAPLYFNAYGGANGAGHIMKLEPSNYQLLKFKMY